MLKNQKLSVASEAANRIADLIRNGEYLPGERLPAERELAEELQVSRTTLRKAINQLETMGLLESRHGSGTFVTDPSETALQSTLITYIRPDRDTIRKLFDLREIIEIEATVRAAQNANENQVKLMRKWAETVETHIARKDLDSMVIADVEFHRQIIIATGNDILVNLMDSITDLLRDMRRDSINIPDLLPNIIKDHRAILAAIEAGDGEAARQAMKNHLVVIRDSVNNYWENQQ